MNGDNSHSGGGLSGVDDDTFTRGELLDSRVLNLVLFSDEWTDVGFETSGAETHDDERNDEACQSRVRVVDDGRDSRDDHENMADPGEIGSALVPGCGT